MDDPTRTAFLVLQGRLSAMQTMLAHLIKSGPEALESAKAAVDSIEAVATALEGRADDDVQLAAIGMREFLDGLLSELDT